MNLLVCRYTLARFGSSLYNVGARSRIISHLGTWDYFGRSRSHRLRIANWELVHLGATEAPIVTERLAGEIIRSAIKGSELGASRGRFVFFDPEAFASTIELESNINVLPVQRVAAVHLLATGLSRDTVAVVEGRRRAWRRGRDGRRRKGTVGERRDRGAADERLGVDLDHHRLVGLNVGGGEKSGVGLGHCCL